MRYSEIVNEAGFLSRIGGKIADKVADAGDRVRAMTYDKSAIGSMQFRKAYNTLKDDWSVFVGRERASGNKTIEHSPTVEDLVDFLHGTYGIDMNQEFLQIFNKYFTKDATPAANQVPETTSESVITEDDNTLSQFVFDPNKLFPAMTSVFLKKGVFYFGDPKPGRAKADMDKDKTTATGVPDASGEPTAPTEGGGLDTALLTKLLGESLSKEQLQYFREQTKSSPQGLLVLSRQKDEGGQKLRDLMVKYIGCFTKALKGNPKNTNAAKLTLFKEVISKAGITADFIQQIQQENTETIQKKVDVDAESYNKNILIIISAIENVFAL